MPIKGMTDRQAQFPKLGTLRKGEPKPDGSNRPGKDLEGFRFDSDDAAATEAFLEAFGDEPRRVNVLLPFRTAAENFQAWREEWTASSLKHRCDGETMTLWLNGAAYSQAPKACTGGCKPVGRLMVIIPELRRLAYVTVLTTSIHDIMTLQENLDAAEMLRGDLRGIPFVLSRRPREISTPRANGQRARTEKWLLSIEPAPHWVGHQLQVMERAAPHWVGHQLQVMERAALPHVKALPDGQHVDTITGEVLDAPRFEDPEGAIEGEVVAVSPPAAKPFDRAKAIQRIRELGRQERDLGSEFAEQNQENLLVLEDLSDDELLDLGTRRKERVSALKAGRVVADAVST
jgi:uncharacterized protein YjiS (DUF1127 family)